MSVKQISAFLENKPGSLKELARVLAENGIDMRAFSLAEASDFGIARIIVDDLYKTTLTLKDAGIIHSVSSVLAVAIPDVPGGLEKVLDILLQTGRKIEYMYAFLGARKDEAYMIFKVTSHHRAQDALRAAGIRLVDQEELSEM